MPNSRIAAMGAAHAWITRINRLIGSAVAWLTLAMVVVTSSVVVMRYGFGKGSIALQESITYMHCMVFMLGAAMTLSRGGHVRVDILYRNWPPRRQALVDLLGTLLLLIPFMVFTILSARGYIADSWSVREGSMESGGLNAVYLLKSLIPVMALMLILQGIAEALRSILVLLGHEAPEGHPSMPREELI
jgi:TRAP-type mannitol/chloroaromatic compound transport system permease small subunit